MRSGLLALGVILLMLGAIFYFLPSSTTQEASVTTQTYASHDGMNQTNNVTATANRDTNDEETEDLADDSNIMTIYIYMDENGNTYDEQGNIINTATAGTDPDASSYRAQDIANTRQTVSDDASAQNTETQTTQKGQDTVDNTENTSNTSDREEVSESAAVASSGIKRTLSVLSMIAGAILTILGLVLPRRRVEYRRTAGAPGRRVDDEEHRRYR